MLDAGDLYIETADDGESTTAEAAMDEEMTISMHVLSGVRMAATLSLDTTIAAIKLATLVDSGSTHASSPRVRRGSSASHPLPARALLWETPMVTASPWWASARPFPSASAKKISPSTSTPSRL
jgi:hypothetical protein